MSTAVHEHRLESRAERSATESHIEPAMLLASVVRERIENVINSARGDRVVYAVVDLGIGLTSAIGCAVSEIRLPHPSRVEVAIHPDLADDSVAKCILSDDVATRFRNRRDPATVATIFSVPGCQVEGVIQSLGSVQRIDEAWLRDPTKAELWTTNTIPGYDGQIVKHLTDIIQGVMLSDILSSAEMLAEFCARLRSQVLGPAGLPLPKAVNDALPALHMPRNAMPSMSSEKLASSAITQFRKLRDDFQPHFYLTSRKGELRTVRELRTRLNELRDSGSIKSEHADAISDLIDDHNVTVGAWQTSQQRVAEISWVDIRKFFEGNSSSSRSHVGLETIEFLESEFPNTLTDDEREMLEELRHRGTSVNSDHRDIFIRHCERLRLEPRLFKKWQTVIFDRALEETGDLIVGLIRLAEKAYQRAKDDLEDSVLFVRLRDAEKKSYWRTEKNWYLCTYLRDRYRGLAGVMEPTIVLDLGRCWEPGILDDIDNPKATGSTSATFEFEAHVVCRSDIEKIRSDRRALGRQHRAQLVWKPGHLSFATALSEDLRRILPDDRDLAALVCSSVTPARGVRGNATLRPSVYTRSSVTDASGETGGSLVNRYAASWRGNKRIDQLWKAEFGMHSETTVSEAGRADIMRKFDEFHRQYSNAVRAMVRSDGCGLGDPAIVAQAECYGSLLEMLRSDARTDTLVRRVWTLLIQIGTSEIEGGAPALFVAPWHPLRLLEFATKARQAASVISRIMKGSIDESVSIADYVRDRVLALQQTFYVDVGLALRGRNNQLLVETESHAGYSLLQPPLLQSSDRLVELPVKDAVAKFGEIAGEYLRQRPHERANFSIVLLDSEAEELPVLVAKHLAREIDSEPHLRCELTVAHGNPSKLREIYERQNRRIGHEIESSLTSEAARIFMSRLRVGIAPTTSLDEANGAKGQDIVLLHDVIARHARLVWDRVEGPAGCEDPRGHAPNDTSRRKSPVQGSLTSSVYLTAPLQIAVTQAYLDVLHDVIRGTASPADEHYVPSQAIDLLSPDIVKKLDSAHSMAHWVVTYDRIADRRLLANANTGVRILRYCSSPRSVHNVIVSTEVRREELQTRLQEDLEHILPDHDPETLDALVEAVQRQATDLAGGIVMRGRHWDNYARELIGVVVAQRELSLLLESQGESRTAMFYLDEFKNWLDLSGEIADILAVNLYADDKGTLIVRLVVAEAKCVNVSASFKSKAKSWAQLEATYSAIINRFATDDQAIDPRVWRNRLADMLLEHMTPWGEQERLGDRNFDEWIELIRNGGFSVDVSGHSIVSVHDQSESQKDLDLFTADGEKLTWERRKLARWTLGADLIKSTIRDVAAPDAKPLLHIPAAWPEAPYEKPEKPDPTQTNVDIPTPEPEVPTPEVPSGDPPDSSPDDADSESTSNEITTHADEHDDPPTGVPDGDSAQGLEPGGWKSAVFKALEGMSKVEDNRHGKEWLDSKVAELKRALQAENMEARIEGSRLTPNLGIVQVDGRSVTVRWLSSKQVDLLTRYGIDIVHITPQPGRIAVAIRRPNRAILHLADAWKRRSLQDGAPEINMAVVVGEQEDDGELFYLSFNEDFEGRERAAPHTLISGTTGSGKGILTSNLILDLCAFNDPRSVEVYLIDPKQGADYLWSRDLPHLREGIVDSKESAMRLLRRLVQEMESRYRKITQHGCANIDQYNSKHQSSNRIPRVVIFFDEVANWMQDDEFKHEVESVINEIATKSRAAGLHLFMIYQRADNQVMTMQLRTNLGNRLILRLGDEGSSKIALGDKGAERLLGKGHIIAKLGSDEKIYGQVPFIGEDEIAVVADAIKRAWKEPQE